MQHILEKLHQASLRLDELANRAQSEKTEEVGAALVLAVSDWVELVEFFIDHCPSHKVLADYLSATQGLERLLTKLEDAQDESELALVRQALPRVVERWGLVIASLIQNSMGSLSGAENSTPS